MSLFRRAEPLRQIIAKLGLEDFRRVLSQPGVNEGLRITVQYHDARHPSSVATLQRGHGDTCSLTVLYDKFGEPLTYTFAIPLERYQKLFTVLKQSKFDTMDDEPDIPYVGADLWLVERGSGTFHHDIVVSPDSAKGHHREVVVAIRTHLPEAVRMINL
jgi:hypothetical protein